jgi:hypothetical protein
MKSKIRIFASILAFNALTLMSVSSQNSGDYAYQNSGSYNNGQDTRYNPGPNDGNGRYQNPNVPKNGNGRNQNSNRYDNNRNDRFQNRAYFTACAELQRLYQIEDALYRRYDANLALGNNREARRDREKLEDVQVQILREENRYAYANPNYRNANNNQCNNRDRRSNEQGRRQ